jgi:AraC-like DNA-binding protein
MIGVKFIRALGIKHLHHGARKRYQIGDDELVIPEIAFDNPMTLLPMPEVNRWYRALEVKTDNPDIILDINQDWQVTEIGSLLHWFLSGGDLATTIRRINYGINSLQNGGFLSASMNGSIAKWVYQNPSVEADVKVHDSVRLAISLVKVMRIYLGEEFAPLRVELSGIRRNDEKYKRFFGCDIGWNHSQTEVWFHSDQRLATQQKNVVKKGRLAMSFSDLDELLNMPSADDEVKVFNEIVNYSRFSGLPTVEHVSSLLGLSTQQLQRRLRARGMNFTMVCGYVLSNIAVSMMEKGMNTDEIARQLGYSNTASFNRMFKKFRGLTPIQYLGRFYDRG